MRQIRHNLRTLNLLQIDRLRLPFAEFHQTIRHHPFEIEELRPWLVNATHKRSRTAACNTNANNEQHNKYHPQNYRKHLGFGCMLLLIVVQETE